MQATKKDILLFVVLALFCGALCALVFSGVFATNGTTLLVYSSGVQVAAYPLDRDQVISLEDNDAFVFRIESGRVSVLRSACPGQDCVHTPPISKAGQSILCAPQKILLKISDMSDADAVAS